MLGKIKEFKKIDAHSHIGYFGSWSDVEITAEDMIKYMSKYNIEKTVISTYPINESVEAVNKYPNKFIGAVWVNPNDQQKSLKEIKDTVINHNFKAIKLHPLFHSYLANDECVFPIAELAEELDVPIMIHSGHPPFSLPWSIAQLADIFPNVKIAMLHMGHGNGMYIQSAIDMAKKYPNLYLETSGMPMHTKIKEGYNDVGIKRIMFGIDSPFHHPTVEIQRMLVSGLDDKGLNDIFYNNVKKFLNI